MENVKIKQKMVKIAKKGSVRWGMMEAGKVKMVKERDAEFPILITSDKPFSPHSSLYMSNTGLQDTVGNVTRFTGVARKEKTKGGARITWQEREVYADNGEIHAELDGFATTFAIVIDESQQWKDGQWRKTFDTSEVELMIVGYQTVSQKRAGGLPFMKRGTDRLAFLKQQLLFRFDVYYKRYVRRNIRMVSLDCVKTASRIKLAMSSGKVIPLFKGYTYKGREYDEYRPYTGADGEEVFSTVLWFEKKDADDISFELMPQDFEVKMKVLQTMPSFKTDEQGVDIVEREIEITRLATDGVCYIDRTFARMNGLNTSGQFRMNISDKGFMSLEHGLEREHGSTVIMFDGSMKGNSEILLRESKLDFALLRRNRRADEVQALLLSRQVFGAIALKDMEILRRLIAQTKDVLNKVYAFDMDTLKEFIGVQTEKDDLDDLETTLDADNWTVAAFQANPEAFLKSASNRRKLAALVRSSTGEMERGGRLYLKDAGFKHMQVDTVAIRHWLKKGRLGLDLATLKDEDRVGIRESHAITAGVDTEGNIVLEHEEAFLARFPFLHYLEGQVVNFDGKPAFYDDRSRDIWEKKIKSRGAQGTVYYSLYDPYAEGQSGADFDGDETVYTTNRDILDYVEREDLFLDYSLLDGKVVEGVPWKGTGVIVTLEEAVNKKRAAKLTEMGVEYDNGTFHFPAKLEDNDFLEHCMADAMAIIGGKSNQKNNIGLFTNVNSSVMEIILSLRLTEKKIKQADGGEQKPQLMRALAEIEKEIKGYEKLSLLLACAIRWEIDKAKHGGMFMEELPFLHFIENGAAEDELYKMEEMFGISLQRLFLGEKRN